MSKAKAYEYPQLVDFAVTHGDRSSDMSEFPPSMTRQEFADDCDINVIMDRYEVTGVINHVADKEPVYLDCTNMPNLMQAMDLMNNADKAFMSLPAKVRREFDNDAMKFVDFASDGANLDQMRSWGLAPPAPEPPEAAPEVSKAPAAPKAPKAPKAPVEPPPAE